MAGRIRKPGVVGLLTGAFLAFALPALAGAAPVPLIQIGGPGTGAGQLNAPFGVGIDAAGNVYVPDFGNDRVSVFGPDGTFLRAFGRDVAPPNGNAAFEVCTSTTGCLQGDGGGSAAQLDGPIDVAFDGAGRLYVLEFHNRRVSVFDPGVPSFTRAFGFDVDPGGIAGFESCTETTGCNAAPVGAGAGQLNSPRAIAIDSAGKVYVADRDNLRIAVFGANGTTFVHAFGFDVAEPDDAGGFEVCPADGACRAGDFGGLAGELADPSGLAVDGAGNLFVGDFQNNRISVFDATIPSFESAFGWDVADPDGGSAFEVCPSDGACRGGDSGGDAGQLAGPTGVAVDGEGRLHVAEQSGNRVSVFSLAGPSFLYAFGKDVAAPDGGGFEVCPDDGACILGEPGAGPGEFNDATGIDVDCRGAVWVTESAGNRVQRLGEPATPLAPCPPTTPPAGRCAGAAATITGTAAADVLAGTPARDVVAGLGGGDVVHGLGGGDLLCGGAGRDRLVGGRGRDRLLGQGGRDTLRGGPGRDVLKGGPGRDILRGGPGRDRQLQ